MEIIGLIFYWAFLPSVALFLLFMGIDWLFNIK